MNRIAEQRKERKLSQKAFGAIIGVAQNTICNWENGKREPDYESLEKMASFFDCSTDYLLGRVDKPWYYLDKKRMLEETISKQINDECDEKPAPTDRGGHSETAERFMDFVDKLTPDQQQLLLAQLQAWTEQNQRQAPVEQQADG